MISATDIINVIVATAALLIALVALYLSSLQRPEISCSGGRISVVGNDWCGLLPCRRELCLEVVLMNLKTAPVLLSSILVRDARVHNVPSNLSIFSAGRSKWTLSMREKSGCLEELRLPLVLPPGSMLPLTVTGLLHLDLAEVGVSVRDFEAVMKHDFAFSCAIECGQQRPRRLRGTLRSATRKVALDSDLSDYRRQCREHWAASLDPYAARGLGASA